MNKQPPARTFSKQRPALAALSPIWELIFLSESLLGLFGSFASLGLGFLGGVTSLVQALADLFGSPSVT